MKHLKENNILEQLEKPNKEISVSEVFKIKTDLKVNGFSKKDSYVPELDQSYIFDKDTTLAILAGFQFNRRVMIQGYHGTGKSTHIEQIAARLNWRCLRINFDSHVNTIASLPIKSILLT